MKEENKKKLAAIRKAQDDSNNRLNILKENRELKIENNLKIGQDFFRANEEQINILVNEIKSISGFPTEFKIDVDKCSLWFKIGPVIQLAIFLKKGQGVYQIWHRLRQRRHGSPESVDAGKILIKDLNLEKLETYFTDFIEEYHKSENL
jgi:hypothetical protein